MRPLRIESAGGLFHVTARGNRRGAIFHSDNDRLTWLAMLGEACARFNAQVLAYCQMTNHFHLVIVTLDGCLPQLMRYLNGKYAQYVNRTHKLVGHLYQGRYHAVLCQDRLYRQALCRYVELNPVHARMVARPADWPWSSHRATMGLQDAPSWLNFEQVLTLFGDDVFSARDAYSEFVLAGVGLPSPLKEVKHNLLLGDEQFCEQFSGGRLDGDISEIKRSQRQALALPLVEFFKQQHDPKHAMALAYFSRAYSMPEIARHAGVSVKTVSRAVTAYMQRAS